MFWQGELERLRQERERLALECDARRALLALEWRLSRSPRLWREALGSAAARHPLLTAAAGVAAGWLGLTLVRRPGVLLRTFGRVGRLGPLLWSLWKLWGRS
jgi:hypothetical protein